MNEPIYIQIKCAECGHTWETTKTKGEIECPICQKINIINKAYDFAKGDWG